MWWLLGILAVCVVLIVWDILSYQYNDGKRW